MIRAVYEPLNRGDWDAVFRHAHPEFELTTQRGQAAGTYRGKEAARELFQELLAPFEAWAVEPEEFFDGGQAVAFLEVRTRPIGSSAEMKIRIGHLWTIRDRTIRSLKTFAVREEALEAAGLRE